MTTNKDSADLPRETAAQASAGQPGSQDAIQIILDRRSVAFRLRLLSMLVGRELASHLTEYDITLKHWVVLGCLWQEDGLSVSKLSAILTQIGGTVSEVLDRMEEAKLVKRKRSRSDKRVWRVYLLDAGKKLFDILPDAYSKLTEALFKGFSAQERADFSAFVDQCIANLRPESCSQSPCLQSNLPGEIKQFLPPHSIGYRLKVVYLLLARLFNEMAAPLAITTPQWHILRCLWREDGLTCSAVSEMVSQMGGNLTAVLNRLEERELVERRQDPKDKRSFRLYLKPGAQALFDPLLQIALSVQAQVFQGIAPEKLNYFSQLVEKSISNLAHNIDGKPVCD